MRFCIGSQQLGLSDRDRSSRPLRGRQGSGGHRHLQTAPHRDPLKTPHGNSILNPVPRYAEDVPAALAARQHRLNRLGNLTAKQVIAPAGEVDVVGRLDLAQVGRDEAEQVVNHDTVLGHDRGGSLVSLDN